MRVIKKEKDKTPSDRLMRIVARKQKRQPGGLRPAIVAGNKVLIQAL
jgi:hypothetical protein